MALTFASKYANEGALSSPQTTASLAMAAGSVCLISVFNATVTPGTAPTATGLTFTAVDNIDDTTNRNGVLYRALIPGGGFSGTIQIGTGGDPTIIYYDVVEVTGAVTTGSNAADAIVQSLGFFEETPPDPYTHNYTSGFSSPSNGGYAVFSLLPGGFDYHPFTPRAGWTKGAEGVGDCDFWITSSDTAAGFSAANPTEGSLLLIMVEIATAGAGPPAPPVGDDTWPDMLGRPQSQSPTVTVFA